MEAVTYLSLGSNLGDRISNLNKAIDELNKIGTVSAISSFYENPAVGFDSTRLFLNICIEFNTLLDPLTLLLRTQEIERFLGRSAKTSTNYESRIIDIDIIYYDSIILQTEELTIPHKNRLQRKFVLTPLNDIAWGFLDPVAKKAVNQLLIECNSSEQLVLFEIKK